jgi:toxin ParE1/3/4
VSPEARRRIVRRALADQDIEAIVDGYLLDGGADVALGFIDTLQHAFERLAWQPRMGSPRHAQELGLPGLRSWPLRTYPHIVFYFEAPDAVEIWRVLHGRRDLPAHLQDAS